MSVGKPQQEAQGAVAWQEQVADALGCFWNAAIGSEPVSHDSTAASAVSGIAVGVEAIATRLREHAATPPAPVDVRSMLPKVTFKNVQRGDSGKYPNGEGWGHAWSAPIVEIERADWDRFIALLDGQPAGVETSEEAWQDWMQFALNRWPESESALLATKAALGPPGKITQADIDWAKAALGGGGGR